MIMSKNAKMTSETLIRVSYYGIFGRNQHSERLPPLLPPFFVPPLLPPLSFSYLQSGKTKIFHFFEVGPNIPGCPDGAAPPFCPPFLNFWKVQNMIYKFCMYHFLSKCVVFALQTQFLKTNQPSYYDNLLPNIIRDIVFLSKLCTHS